MLDKRRLGKQRVEAKQLIDTIIGRPMANGKARKGWRNHPAAVMYLRYIDSLINYYNISLAMFNQVGGKNSKLEPEDYIFVEKPLYIKDPWWHGVPEIHATHRGRLKFKGKLDVLSDRIKRFTGERGPNKWLKRNGFPELNYFTENNYQDCSIKLDVLGADYSPLNNFYDQYGWSEPDTLQYVWPGRRPEDPFRTKIDGKMVEMTYQQVQDYIDRQCQNQD